MDSCTPMADVAGGQHLRSASQRKLIVPRYRLNSFGRRCFAVADPTTWNSLPDSLRDPAPSLNIFRRQLKTHFFAKYWRDVLSALEIFFENALYKFTLYLLTYIVINFVIIIVITIIIISRRTCSYKRSQLFLSNDSPQMPSQVQAYTGVCPPLRIMNVSFYRLQDFAKRLKTRECKGGTVVFHSCVFHPCNLVPCFPLPGFPRRVLDPPTSLSLASLYIYFWHNFPAMPLTELMNDNYTANDKNLAIFGNCGQMRHVNCP